MSKYRLPFVPSDCGVAFPCLEDGSLRYFFPGMFCFVGGSVSSGPTASEVISVVSAYHKITSRFPPGWRGSVFVYARVYYCYPNSYLEQRTLPLRVYIVTGGGEVFVMPGLRANLWLFRRGLGDVIDALSRCLVGGVVKSICRDDRFGLGRFYAEKWR